MTRSSSHHHLLFLLLLLLLFLLFVALGLALTSVSLSVFLSSPDTQQKFRAQKNLVDTVRLDRNVYCKALNQHREQIEEHKNKFTHLNLKIHALKSEIRDREASEYCSSTHRSKWREKETESKTRSRIKCGQGNALRIDVVPFLFRDASLHPSLIILVVAVLAILVIDVSFFLSFFVSFAIFFSLQ